MKNYFFVPLFVLIALTTSQAQITFEANYATITSQFSAVRFGLAGDKYVLVNRDDKAIEIYGLNHALEISLSIPSIIVSDNWYVRYVSDNLFDLDSTIEYWITDVDTVSLSWTNVYVLKEDGSILFHRDSIFAYATDESFMVSEFGLVIPTTEGTKMTFERKVTGWEVYSLPGNLPCYECSNGVFTGNFSSADQNKNSSGLSNPYPNPTSNLTRIDYQLPNGIKKGELVFYNTNGNEVKRFNVTSTFSFISISAHDLPSGTYYYNLETSAGASEGKKLVVIR